MMQLKQSQQLGRRLCCLTAAAASAIASLGSDRALASGPLPFTPLNQSAPVGVLPENAPLLMAPGFQQNVLVDRLGTFVPGGYAPGSVGGGTRWSNWDQIAMNATGPDANRYVFIANEVAGHGVTRYDYSTGHLVNLAPNVTTNNGRLDPVRWTPWGTVISGDENNGGQMFEVTNPLVADPANAVAVPRSALGRVAFEGLGRAANGTWYYGDELAGGGMFKYVPHPSVAGTANELTKGQIFALKIASPTLDHGNSTGNGTWVALNNPDGTPISGIPDPTVNTRTAAAAVGATGFNRPEDGSLATLANGHTAFYVAVTGTHSVMSFEFNPDDSVTARNFATQDSFDLGTGTAAGSNFSDCDNIEVDSSGRVFVVEDLEPNGGDVWATVDLNNDGVISGPGEGVGRWVSLGTAGSEATGLFFDNARGVAYLNVQHPTSGNDMTLVISVPEPASMGALGIAAISVLGRRRRNARN